MSRARATRNRSNSSAGWNTGSTRHLERAFSAVSHRAAIATTFADCNAADAVAEADAAKAAWYNQRRSYRQLRHKSAKFWRGELEANQSDPHKLWKIVDDLLGRGREPSGTTQRAQMHNPLAAYSPSTSLVQSLHWLDISNYSA